MVVKGHAVVIVLGVVGNAQTVLWLVGHLLEICQCVFVIHVVVLQYFLGTIVHLVVENGKQQVSHVYGAGALQTGLKNCQFQNVACFVVQYQFTGVDGTAIFIGLRNRLQFFFHRLDVDVHALEQRVHLIGTVAKYTHEQMLRPYPTTGKPCGLFPAIGEDF